jgi:hypothetical protein
MQESFSPLGTPSRHSSRYYYTRNARIVKALSILIAMMAATGYPTPTEIRAARILLGVSQAKAAFMVHSTCRAWQQWEAGDRKMHPAFWELFRIKAVLNARMSK